MPNRHVSIANELVCCTITAHVFKLFPTNEKRGVAGLPLWSVFGDGSRGRILGRNWDKSLFLPAIHSHLYYGFYSPLPLSKSGLKLVCNVNIVYGNLKSENSQEYALKPQRKLYVHEFGFRFRKKETSHSTDVVWGLSCTTSLSQTSKTPPSTLKK
jgi:hypothetical protein